MSSLLNLFAESHKLVFACMLYFLCTSAFGWRSSLPHGPFGSESKRGSRLVILPIFNAEKSRLLFVAAGQQDKDRTCCCTARRRQRQMHASLTLQWTRKTWLPFHCFSSVYPIIIQSLFYWVFSVHISFLLCSTVVALSFRWQWFPYFGNLKKNKK